MNFINLLKKFSIKSQLYVAFCATFLGTFVLKEQNSYQSILAIILFLTFWNGYFFTVFHKKKRTLFLNLLGFLLISFLILYFFELKFYYKWLFILGMGILYNADVFNIKVREFALIKTFYVGLVWAATLVYLPFNNLNIIWFIIIFLFVSAITFPFEIRDMGHDKFPTLPKVLGTHNTKMLSIFFLTICGFLGFLNLKKEFVSAWILTVFASMFLVMFSGKKRKEDYYSFFMESLSALPLLIYFILNLKN